MKHLLLTAAACAALVLLNPAAARTAALPSTNTAWIAASTDAEIDKAFARAKVEKKPVLLYWGATWCPPCNQLKSTLFSRADFAALAKGVIPVAVDGDRPGAQKLGQRFKVVGYPSTVLFTPQGQEITRLPGEVDAPQALAVLQLGLAGGRPVKSVLGDALGGKAVTPTEWRLLAFYAWDIDEDQVVSKAQRPATLVQLAAASAAGGAEPEVTSRLWLKAMASAEDAAALKADAALRERLLKVLADPAQARAQMDVLTNFAADMVKAFDGLPDVAAQKPALLAAFDGALRKLQDDTTLSRADRLQALIARVELGRIDQPKAATQVNLPEPLLKDLREFVAKADREITDGYERQAVITSAASGLGKAGLWAESEALLKANLSKSHSPYYLMSQLASNARKLGQKEDALKWYGEAWAKSVGPSTRLQWGNSYLTALVELAPQDEARIEKTLTQMLKEAAQDPSALDGRSARSLQRSGVQLQKWGSQGQHAAALQRLRTQVAKLCGKPGLQASQRSACEAILPMATAAKAGSKPA